MTPEDVHRRRLELALAARVRAKEVKAARYVQDRPGQLSGRAPPPGLDPLGLMRDADGWREARGRLALVHEAKRYKREACGCARPRCTCRRLDPAELARVLPDG